MGVLFSSWDASVFYLINAQWQNSLFDWLMPFITDLKNFYAVLGFLALWIVWRDKKAGIIFLLFIGLTLAVTDPLSSRILKVWLGRIRPCHVLENVHLLTDCNSSYSFPSSHAVNIFAAAFFLARSFKKLSPAFYAVAVLVCYSRVYLGIHYPLDVLGGAGIGLLVAWPMYRLKDAAVDYVQRNQSPGTQINAHHQSNKYHHRDAENKEELK